MPSIAAMALSLTLSQAIARAEQAGFQVRVASADAQSAAAQAAASRAALFPRVSFSATTSNGGITQLGMPLAQQNYVSTNVSVPLFTPNAFETAQAAGRSAQAAELTQAQTVNDAMLSAVQGYEGTLLAQAVYDAREITVAYEQRHLRDVNAMVKAGALPRYVSAESQAALAQAEQSLEDAAAQRDEAMNDLKVTLAFDISAPVTLTDPLQPLALKGSEDAFLARATASRPDVLAAQRQVASAQARIAAARWSYVPVISAIGQTYNGGSKPSLGNHGYQVGVSASLPIIDGGDRAAAVRLAQADLARAQVVLDEVRLSAQRDVMNAWRELQAAQHNVETARMQQTAAAQALRVAALRERSGKGVTLETLDALLQDASARESLLRAIARFNVAIASAHRAAGDSAIQ